VGGVRDYPREDRNENGTSERIAVPRVPEGRFLNVPEDGLRLRHEKEISGKGLAATRIVTGS
jgi:hypothetical protein